MGRKGWQAAQGDNPHRMWLFSHVRVHDIQAVNLLCQQWRPHAVRANLLQCFHKCNLWIDRGPGTINLIVPTEGAFSHLWRWLSVDVGGPLSKAGGDHQ